MGQILNRMVTLSAVLQFFCLNEWRMGNGNVQRMQAVASEQERKIFPFDLTEVDWDVYYRRFVPGVVKYAIEPRRSKHLAKKIATAEGVAVKKLGLCCVVWSFLALSATEVFKFLFGKDVWA